MKKNDTNETIRVAVYGTLLTGEGNYRVGADALEREPCRMSGTLYDPNAGASRSSSRTARASRRGST